MKLETFKFDIDGDGIAHAVFDVPGRSMNTLTGQAVADIIAILRKNRKHQDFCVNETFQDEM